MNVVIIEDEPLTAQRLEKLLSEYDASIRVVAQIASVAKAVQWFSEQTAQTMPDLVFMDIHLEDDSGFRIIEKTGLTIPIIFTTAYDMYALQAFKSNSIDYLLKPIDEDELVAAIEKFKAIRQAPEKHLPEQPDWSALMNFLDTPKKIDYKNRFMVTIGPKIKSIDVADIAYFFYEQKATYLTTNEGQNLVVEYSLDKICSLLDPNLFFRVNRAYLVAVSAIQTIHSFSGSKFKLDLLPKPRHEVFVSSDRMTEFKIWLGK